MPKTNLTKKEEIVEAIGELQKAMLAESELYERITQLESEKRAVHQSVLIAKGRVQALNEY